MTVPPMLLDDERTDHEHVAAVLPDVVAATAIPTPAWSIATPIAAPIPRTMPCFAPGLTRLRVRPGPVLGPWPVPGSTPERALRSGGRATSR